MSLDNYDNYIIQDGDPVDPALNAVVLPKFGMHLYQSSLNETHFKWLVKCYVILEDLHPRIVPAGMTMDRLLNDAIGLYVHHFLRGGLWGDWFSFQSMTGKNCKPCLKDAPTSLKKWKHKFFLVDWRAAPIAMACRHHDSSVANPFPKPSEYNKRDVANLREIAIPLHKPYNNILYAVGLSLVWKEAGHVPILKGTNGKVLTMAEFLRIPNLYGCKVVVEVLLPPDAALETEVACRKVLADKEKKKRKAKAKEAAKANDADDIHIERVVSNKRADKAGSPLDLITKNVEEPAVGEDRGNDHDDINVAIEGHGDNADGLFGLRTQPSPNNRFGYFAGRFVVSELCRSFDSREKLARKLEKEKKKAEELNVEQADHIKHLEDALKQSEEDAHQLRLDREKFAVKYGNGEMRMIATPGEPNLPVLVPETFHEHTDEELTEIDIKWMDADDQAIQTILLGLPEDVYDKRHVTIVRQTKNLHEADFTQIYEFLKMKQDEVNDLRAERLAKTHDHLELMAHSQNSYNFPATHNDQSSSITHSQQSFPINNKYNPQPSLNQNFMQPPMTSFKDINDPTENIKGNGGNKFGQYAGQVAQNHQGYNAWQNGIANQNRTGNIVAARAEGTGNRNQARYYNCRGLGHIARNCIARPMRRYAAYFQTQLLIAQKEEARIQLQAEEFYFMAAAYDLDKIEEINANCILMANLHHASTSGTQLDKASVYDTDDSAEYTDLLEPIPEPQLVLQNDNHVTSVAPSMVQSREEKKRLKHDFKTQEDKYLDKEVDLEAKIKDLENILLKRDQTVQTMHILNPKPYAFYYPDQKMALGYLNPLYIKKAQLKQQSLYNGNLLLEEHDPPVVYDPEETLELAQESHEKMRFLKKEIKSANYAKINHLLGVFIPQTTKSKEELFLLNVFNMVTVSKTISIPNEDLSDDTTPSFA
uniref:CCHC-type domain-containing protein n=1 Tax=Tanacetum cinerariifolium TaxID=118510 RepID=A0A6L2L9N5_TANCI|nr:hypothetical protein [Tanacetum cinerariifolium]